MKAAVALFMAAMMVSAVADDRIHPICDDTKTPRCWVPHLDQPKPPVAISPQVREQMVPPQPPPGAGIIAPEVRAQMVRPLPPPGPYGYRRPLLFRFGPLFVR
jgi:hypothetical protein